MKLILPLISVVTLLTATGCIFPGHRGGGEYREHGEYHGHGDYREHAEYRTYVEPSVDVRVHVP